MRGQILHGDCLNILPEMPDGSADLIITSPPYNIGKRYEKRTGLEEYLAWQGTVIGECARLLSPRGSLCWQVGNHVSHGEIVQLDMALHGIFRDTGLRMRNRIAWHFGHGHHCRNRLSGRYEVVLWYTKSDRYTFNLDDIRVPQKQPTKRHYKGPKRGQLSCNPLGKNPSDVWDIPNIKHNRPEKTGHPVQFPEELVRRLVLALSNPSDAVLDPFAGSGTVCAVAERWGRRYVGIEISAEYCGIARRRLAAVQLTLGAAS